MNVPTNTIHAYGHEFFALDGALMAAPILLDGTVEWSEAVVVTDDGDGDPRVIDGIRDTLGL